MPVKPTHMIQPLHVRAIPTLSSIYDCAATNDAAKISTKDSRGKEPKTCTNGRTARHVGNYGNLIRRQRQCQAEHLYGSYQPNTRTRQGA